MPSFTLIIATLGRTTELNALLESIALQNFPAVECLVIDQNGDDRLDGILARWRPRLDLRRMRAPSGVSRSRNLGLLHATGDVIAFPDDDCWYTPRLLADVSAWFDENPDFGILTVGAKDLDGVASGNRWPQDRCEIMPVNAFRTTFCSSIFVRRSAASGAGCFDETIGPGSGTPWACGEETDYVLHVLRHGVRGVFDRRWHVGHPKRDMLSGEIDHTRAAGYGRGMGHVLRKHKLFLLGAGFVFYDLFRAMLVFLKGDRKAAALCGHHAKGILYGLGSHRCKPAAKEEHAAAT